MRELVVDVCDGIWVRLMVGREARRHGLARGSFEQPRRRCKADCGILFEMIKIMAALELIDRSESLNYETQ